VKLRFVVCVTLAAVLAIAGSSSDQDTWTHFLSWYKTYTGPPYAPDVMKAYTGALRLAGKSDADIQTSVAAVGKRAAESPTEMVGLIFDNIYTRHSDLFLHDASALVVAATRNVAPGKALDIAMGQGRNAVFLARQGWTVTGYDLSAEGLAQARENARVAGVAIDAVQSTHDKFDFGTERWDLIVMAYSLVDMHDVALLTRIKQSLRRGGLIVVEQGNSAGEGKGPSNALFRNFEDLRVLRYEDTVDIAEWNRKPQRIGRIVAQKD
jgi:SAM-dependent methyltransferase